ncbi:uncharacterized protein LOC105183595 [Harpegnathos saltator]|uniref:uncharacterized protein LOC105183595 n=1 Tax=Harpegnathos saltator TaxID=610380 RepID=UPI00058FD6C9|nr:uncharacterized protein LOC105183595 [Harpegnathos saltator]
MNVTRKQKEMLLNYLQEKPDLIRGRINRKSESRQKLNAMWDEVADCLNSAEGPCKSGKEWEKTWKDIKGYILKKKTKRWSYMQQKGGGCPLKIVFSDFEEDFEETVLQLLTSEAAGLENIPEEGFMSAINNINCDIGRRSDIATENLEVNYGEEIDEEQNIENITANYTSTPEDQCNNYHKIWYIYNWIN